MLWCLHMGQGLMINLGMCFNNSQPPILAGWYVKKTIKYDSLQLVTKRINHNFGGLDFTFSGKSFHGSVRSKMFSFKMTTLLPHGLTSVQLSIFCLLAIFTVFARLREKRKLARCNSHIPTLTFFDMGLRAGGQICATGVNLANLCHWTQFGKFRVNAANYPLTHVSGLTCTKELGKVCN